MAWHRKGKQDRLLTANALIVVQSSAVHQKVADFTDPLLNVRSDVTAACDAARGLASSVGISADEANASAKPAYDKMFDIIVRATLLMLYPRTALLIGKSRAQSAHRKLSCEKTSCI